jgi:hypothetical protein
MTEFNEFDRLLGDWLHDGPNRAPDRPIELAVEHARAHPRRRDPLRFLRPDPMAAPFRGFGMSLRPVMILAMLGLLLAAIVAVGVGGAAKDPLIVVSSASPSASAPPASPTEFVVDLTVPEGQPQTVLVIDGSALIVEASSGAPSGFAGATFPDTAVDVTNLDPTTLELGWSGLPCATDHTLTVEPDGRTMTLERPACENSDTVLVDRILVLRFSEPVSASDVTISLAR